MGRGQREVQKAANELDYITNRREALTKVTVGKGVSIVCHKVKYKGTGHNPDLQSVSVLCREVWVSDPELLYMHIMPEQISKAIESDVKGSLLERGV